MNDSILSGDLSLSARTENVRDCYCCETVRFNLEEIYTHFVENIEAINKQNEVINNLKNTSNFSEAKVIMRSQIVFLASSLDFYMHELTKYGLCQIYDEIWSKTEKYEHITIDLKTLEVPLKNNISSDWFLDCVNELYRNVTMVSYSSIKTQINLLGLDFKEIAKKAFYQQGSTEKPKDKMERILTLLFKRRNIIAHQFDREHSNAEIQEISEDIVSYFVENVKIIVDAIQSYAKEKDKDIYL